mmetsp:Transcript_25513/g.65593  ORF Transcript_25513/g.65593 Transcript_25513/m.65593 type:complete len:313 (+) Transcript_25513:36-974(+)
MSLLPREAASGTEVGPRSWQCGVNLDGAGRIDLGLKLVFLTLSFVLTWTAPIGTDVAKLYFWGAAVSAALDGVDFLAVRDRRPRVWWPALAIGFTVFPFGVLVVAAGRREWPAVLRKRCSALVLAAAVFQVLLGIFFAVNLTAPATVVVLAGLAPVLGALLHTPAGAHSTPVQPRKPPWVNRVRTALGIPVPKPVDAETGVDRPNQVAMAAALAGVAAAAAAVRGGAPGLQPHTGRGAGTSARIEGQASETKQKQAPGAGRSRAAGAEPARDAASRPAPQGPAADLRRADLRSLPRPEAVPGGLGGLLLAAE